jgi:peptide deformylase
MPETALRIKFYGEPVLRRKAAAVQKVSSQERDILNQMVRLMHASSGIGLAAPQVGIAQAMIVVDIGSGLYKLINPKIIKRQGQQVTQEGCLSIPGICIKVKRAKKILVQAQDETGKPLDIAAEDLLACVLQHEIDHLKGKLITDYGSFFEKLKIVKKLADLKEKVDNASLPQPETKSQPLQL